jgi:hypothetical protein
MMMEEESNKNLHIVLVHGTWGRGLFRLQPIAPWCQEGSSFRRGLLNSLQQSMPNVHISVSPFNWSGANSILERAKASQELVSFLGNIKRAETVLIIAHSHGGNVAIRAVGKLDDPSRVYLCTLATPFFRLFESGREYPMSDHVIRILSVASLGFVMSNLYQEFLSGSSKAATVASLLLTLSICTIGGWKLGGSLHRLFVNPPPEFGQDPTAWQLRPKLLCEAAAFDAGVLNDQLLVLRGVDDEAAMSLAVGAMTNRILRFLYDFMVTPKVHFAFLAILLVLFFSTKESPLFSYGQFIIFGIAAFALVFPSVVRIVFGRELAFGVLRCDATYDSAPVSGRATIETLLFETKQSNRIVHAIYENPATPIAISKWASMHPALLLPSKEDAK